MTATLEPPDILSAEFARDPYAAYRLLRDEFPLVWHDGMQTYVISRYDDVQRAFKDPVFTSDNYAWQLEPVHGRTILQMEGREHSTHRSLVAPAFRGKALQEQFGPTIRRNSRELVDAFRADGHVDLVDAFATRFPINVIVDMLGLPREDADRLWIVASNGAVVFRYPPMEVVHEETFDAAPAVGAFLEHHPNALVGVEERGIGGYRVNGVFPTGELTGEQVVTDVEEIIGVPVSRVIIRDPDASADDFVALAERLGLQGTGYVVGWTAWLDIAPAGVSKASGLQYVADELGVEAADVMAIGDGRNDIEMLEWAGRGVAMGQAVEDVRAAADDVTATVYDDGAALEISRWFPA
jgi:hydroxymethylpyrimidine pyrophosphatase-like HAD family hydrolase